MKKFLLIICVSALTFAAFANPQSGEPKKADGKSAPADTAAAPVPSVPGLFGVLHEGDDWFFDIPDSLLGRRILAVTRFISSSVDAGVYGGEEIEESMLYWEKAPNGKLLLRSDVLSIHSSEEDAISKAVKVSSENPIIASFKIEKGAVEGSRVKVTSLFEDEIQAFSFSASQKKSFNVTGAKKDATFINSIRTYPINTEVSVTRTFAYNSSSNQNSALPAGTASGFVTVQTNTSFLLLPEEPMQPRLFDARVGYFVDGYTEFSDDQQITEDVRFITRWRLEAKPEDIEKQKRGELVEPVKPIVYYIDPATPKQWRKYLIAGVNDWQVAFEKAGWKNAIHAEEWPEDNPDMSLEDARFAVIRYLASPIANAYGPNVHDPRSGEIIESHVGWYHNVMSLVHDWYQIQAGVVDPRAHSIKFSEELMGDLIRFVSSHEIGHTLGLRHNMGSSSQTPVEKLRDAEWLRENGHTISIMDYARFNYVAQPEDGVDISGLYPRIGEYDKWAIEFGYRPTYIDDVKEDHLYWNNVIIAKLQENPRLWFGGEGRDADPRAQTEDLGDNSVKASEYGLKNLKRVVANIPEWNAEEGDHYVHVRRMYEEAVDQFIRYAGHVTRNIGGRYITERSIEQPGPKYQAVPKDRQVDALNYIDRNIFHKPEWLVNVPYIHNLTDRPDSYLYTIINNTVSTSGLFDIAKLTRMEQFSQTDTNTYKPEDYLSDMTSMVFSELFKGGKVDSYRRYLQRRYVSVALDVVNASANKMADGRTLILAELQRISNKAKKASSSDAVTKAHWQAIHQMIQSGLK